MARPRAQIDARPTKRQTDKARAAIQASKLIAHLQRVGLGEVKASPTSVRAALGLLNKVIPDLSATTIEDVTPNHGTPEDAKANFDALVRDRLIDQLTRAGITPEKAEAIADGKVTADEE